MKDDSAVATFGERRYRAWASAVSLCLFAVVLACAPSLRAAEDNSNTFLTPFPEGEIYQLAVFGDWFADGVLFGLIESMGQDGRLNIHRKVREFQGVMGAEFEARLRDLEAAVAREPVTIAVVMIGANDRISLRNQQTGRRVPVASEEWIAEYTRRIELVMKVFKRANLGVYWVGLPNLSRNEANEQAQKMNDIIRERAYLNGYKYIDAFAGFADESGAYSAYGPDLQGKIRVLRSGEGFTEAGNRKLAHFIEKDLRRDLNRAKANRTIPLLGSEAEQAKVNPDNAVKTPAPSSPVAPAGDAPTVKAAKVDGTRARRCGKR